MRNRITWGLSARHSSNPSSYSLDDELNRCTIESLHNSIIGFSIIIVLHLFIWNFQMKC